LAAVGYLQIRASGTDRDRTVDVLKSAFAEGRITKAELDQRVGEALGQRYFADLIALIDDLPAGVFARLPAHPATPAKRRKLCAAVTSAHTGSVITGFGNEQAKDAVRRTLAGGSSGRAAVLLIAAAFLALGIYAGSLLISVPFGAVTVVAGIALVRAVRADRAVRRIERAH